MSGKFRLGSVLLVATAHLCHDIYASFLSPLLPLLIGKLGISLSQAGFLDVMRNIPSLFNPLVGIMADRVSVRYFVIFAPAVTAAAMSLVGLSPSYGILLIALFVAGIGSTLFHVPAPVMIKKLSGSKTGAGMSLFMLGGELSRTLGPLIITAAVSIWGLEGSFRLMPFGLAASAVLYFKLRNVQITEGFAEQSARPRIWLTFTDHLRFFLFIAGFIACTAGMRMLLTLYLPAYLTHQGRTLWQASYSLSLLQLAGAAGTLTSGFVADRIGKRNTLLISSIASPLLLWLFISAGDAGALALLPALGFFIFAPVPVLLAWVQDKGSDHPSFMNGIYMTIMFGVSSILTMIIGISVDAFGYEATYRLAMILGAAGIPFVFFIQLTE